jgi:endonuclease-3
MKKMPQKRLKVVSFKLEKLYGKKKWIVHTDPLSELIATILSQNTSDHNSHRAYINLRSKFKTWDGVRKADVRKIADTIRSGGLEDVKAERIKKILNQIHAEIPHSDGRKKKIDLNLEFLKRWSTQKIKDYLRKFKGVGEKTIACVLLFSLKRPSMPVDTHVLRVSKRLGLVPENIDAKKAEVILEELIPKNLIYRFHLNLIEHGRKTCKSTNPRCGNCVLLENCDYGKRLLKV